MLAKASVVAGSFSRNSRVPRQLARVGDQDYFERGLELAIEQDGVRVEPVDISDLYAVEVDA